MSVLTFGRAVSVEEKGSQLHRLVTENLAGSHSCLNTEGKQLVEREMGEDTGPNKAGKTERQPWSGQVWKREKPRLCLGVLTFPPRIFVFASGFHLSSQKLLTGAAATTLAVGVGEGTPLSFTDHLSLYP